MTMGPSRGCSEGLKVDFGGFTRCYFSSLMPKYFSAASEITNRLNVVFDIQLLQFFAELQ